MMLRRGLDTLHGPAALHRRPHRRELPTRKVRMSITMHSSPRFRSSSRLGIIPAPAWTRSSSLGVWLRDARTRLGSADADGPRIGGSARRLDCRWLRAALGPRSDCPPTPESSRHRAGAARPASGTAHESSRGEPVARDAGSEMDGTPDDRVSYTIGALVWRGKLRRV